MPLKNVFSRHAEITIEIKKLKKPRKRNKGSDFVKTSFKSFKLTLVNTKYKARAVTANFKSNLEVVQSVCLVIGAIYRSEELSG